MAGIYFEDYVEGATFQTRGRTITEADIVAFAGLSYDTNPLHTDAEYAKATPFGQRIAHGALGFSAATGLAWQLGFLEGTVVAFTETEWKFRAPIYIGDTVRLTLVVSKLRASKAVGGGFVTVSAKLINQRGEVTQKGDWTYIVRSRPDQTSQQTVTPQETPTHSSEPQP
jgi:3-hydroxybutyryl-CoA dehydratase